VVTRTGTPRIFHDGVPIMLGQSRCSRRQYARQRVGRGYGLLSMSKADVRSNHNNAIVFVAGVMHFVSSCKQTLGSSVRSITNCNNDLVQHPIYPVLEGT
jgi:hypothetical protein